MVKSFFRPVSVGGDRVTGVRYRPPGGGHKGDRMLPVRLARDPVPEHRVPGETLEGRGKVGLTNARVLDRAPRGCAFWVENEKGRRIGYFDLDGYWCVVKADRRVEVRRGAPRRVNRLLSKEQRKELERRRLNARRKGVR